MAVASNSLDFYTWNTPNGWKVGMALEEMELAYNVKPVNLKAKEQLSEGFLQINPNNKIPALTDRDGPGGPVSLFESGAILEYLADKTGRLMPKSPAERWAVRCWLYWQSSGLGPMCGQAVHFASHRDQAYARQRFIDEVRRLLGVLQRHLEKQNTSESFLVGTDLTVADCAVFPWLHKIRTEASTVGVSLDEFPCVRAYEERLRARPAVQKTLRIHAELMQAPRRPGST